MKCERCKGNMLWTNEVGFVKEMKCVQCGNRIYPQLFALDKTYEEELKTGTKIVEGKTHKQLKKIRKRNKLLKRKLKE